MVKGTTLTSYNPTLRDKFAWALSDMFGGGDRGRTNWINEKARGVADIVPGLGDAIGVEETKDAFNAGNYYDAALSGATTAVGAIPGGGDLAAAGLKGAGSALGILAGPSSRGWRQDIADKATDMLDQGYSADEVWLETGYVKEPRTGNMKYEIPDHNAAIHPATGTDWGGLSAHEALKQYGWTGQDEVLGLRVDDVLTHPELFDAYPDFRMLGLTDLDDQNGRPGGFFKEYENLVGVASPNNIAPAYSKFGENTEKDSRSTLLHELQHAVQDIEGWDPGFNPQAAMSTFTRPDSFATQTYWKAVNEVARDRGAAVPTPGAAFDFSMRPEIQELNLGNKVAFETYLRNVGETEARNVQTRAEMDPMLRIAKRPALTQDRSALEQLTWRDIVSGSYDASGVPGLSLRGAAKKRPIIEPIIDLRDLLNERD